MCILVTILRRNYTKPIWLLGMNDINIPIGNKYVLVG